MAQWYRPDGTRTKRGIGQGVKKNERREAVRVAAAMEAKDRKAKDFMGRKFEEILSRAQADAKAGKLSAERAADYLAELRKVADPDYRVVTLAQHLESWCEEKSVRVRAKTYACYLDMKRRFTNALGPKVMNAPLGNLTQAEVEAALRKMRDSGLKASTINSDLRAFRQALKQGLDDGLVSRNVTAGIKPLPEDDSTERAPFEAAEVRRMITHEETPEEWRGVILFGGHTGLRLGDVVQLGLEHIDGTDIVIRPTKTSRRRKTIRIPLSSPLVAWIKGKQGKFFPSLAKMKSPTLSTQFIAIMKRAGVPAEVTLPGGIPARRSFHSLRHSFASWLAEADIHADVRQRLTGHSSAGVHARYTHHDKTLIRAIETLPNLLQNDQKEHPEAVVADASLGRSTD